MPKGAQLACSTFSMTEVGWFGPRHPTRLNTLALDFSRVLHVSIDVALPALLPALCRDQAHLCQDTLAANVEARVNGVVYFFLITNAVQSSLQVDSIKTANVFYDWEQHAQSTSSRY